MEKTEKKSKDQSSIKDKQVVSFAQIAMILTCIEQSIWLESFNFRFQKEPDATYVKSLRDVQYLYTSQFTSQEQINSFLEAFPHLDNLFNEAFSETDEPSTEDKHQLLRKLKNH